MDATRTLPENYHLSAGFNLKDRKMLLIMNAAGLVLLVLFGWLFTKLAIWLRPADATAFMTLKWEGIGIFLTIVIVLAILFVTITIHEAIHGLGFYALANAKPVFAFRGAYAYAAAPNWYIPRNKYLVTALAPFVLISVIGVGLMTIAPATWIAPLVLACVINASGAVGDLWVALLLLRQPPEALSNDAGDEIKIFTPVPAVM